MEVGNGGKERSLRSGGGGATAWRQGTRRGPTEAEDGGRFLGEAHRKKGSPFFFLFLFCNLQFLRIL